MKKDHFRTTIRITWLVIIFCLVAITGLIKIYLIDGAYQSDYWYFIYSIPIIIPALVFIMLLYNVKRAYDSGETQLKHGPSLAHWTYPEYEWRNFNEAEWRKSRNLSIFVPLGVMGVIFILLLLDPEMANEGIPLAAPFLIIFFVGLSVAMIFYNYALFRSTFSCPREVVIGRKGFLYGGYYITWDITAAYLAEVKYVSGDLPKLEFYIKTVGKSGSSPRPVRVPVPPGKEYEAQQVADELNKTEAAIKTKSV